eukprot:scaffold2768_cov314-Prasinococcus_capsulatus_cf.AAC.4
MGDAHLLFGRGLRAGIDRKEQKKVNAVHEQELRTTLRRRAGVELTREEEEAERRAVERKQAYDANDMKVRRPREAPLTPASP